jgi:hypothetical protein
MNGITRHEVIAAISEYDLAVQEAFPSRIRARRGALFIYAAPPFPGIPDREVVT